MRAMFVRFLFPVLVGFFVTSTTFQYFNLKYSGKPKVPPMPVLPTEDKNINPSSKIIKNNPFKLQINRDVPKKTRSSDYALIGLLKGDNITYALIRTSKEIFTVSDKEMNRDCLIVDSNITGIKLNCDNENYSLIIMKSSERTAATNRMRANNNRFLSSATTTSISLRRSEILNKFGDINKIFTKTRVMPIYKDNRFTGYQIAALAKDSPIRDLGLDKGDIIVRINGESTEDPSALYSLLQEIDDMDSLTVDLLRKGEPKTIYIGVQ